MADTKVSALTNHTAPIGADYVPIIDSTGPTSKSITMATMHQIYTNQSVTTPAAGFATDTYLVGSSITVPAGGPYVGTKFTCRFSVSKTAVGTAAPVVTLRFGTAGTTADTAICAFTFSAGTAATDTGLFEVTGVFRTVGAATSAVVQGYCSLISQPTTGISSLLKGVATTSAGFNSTTASSKLGVSVNGGTSAVWTIALVRAELML